METLAPKIGTYMIWDVYYEKQNGKSYPVAEVQFKKADWSKFGNEHYKVRLRGLFNKSSVGPKDIKLNIIFHCLHIKEMIRFIDPDTTNYKYKMVWDISKPLEYDELIQQRAEIEVGYLPEFDEELHSIICEEYQADFELASNGDARINNEGIEEQNENYAEDDEEF